MNDILIIDDEKDIRDLIADIMADEGYAPRVAANSDGAMEALAEKLPELVVLDIWLKDSDMDGIDILKRLKIEHPHIPVVIISGHGNIEIAVTAVKQGAYDFIEKPFNTDQLLVVVARALEAGKLRRENSELRNQGAPLANMIGSSAAFKALVNQLDKLVKSNSRVMITGAPGTGKEQAARYIHQSSSRAAGPFVLVNCATLDSEDAQEQLFGRMKGGQLEPGFFDQAQGGVLLLDEVADMPLDTQSKLLRVLVDQKFTPLGANEKKYADIRMIATSARDLQAEIEAGRMREELFHRLNVVPVHIPSLHQRRDDIPELAEYIVAHLHQMQGLAERKLTDEALAVLQSMEMPGNIRQLRNILEATLILGAADSPISADEIARAKPDEKSSSSAFDGAAFVNLPLREARELFEREYLLSQISRFGGNISKTAGFVGMERSALHRKMKMLGVVGASRRKTDEDDAA